MWVIDFVHSAPSPKWRALAKLQYFVSLEEKVSAVLENAEINVEIVPDGTSSCLDLNYLLHLPKLPTVLVSLKPEFSAICVWNPAVIWSEGNQTHQWGEYVLCVFDFLFFLWGWPVLWALDCVAAHSLISPPWEETPSVSSNNTSTSNRGHLYPAHWKAKGEEMPFFPFSRGLISNGCWVLHH